jgi:glutamate-1-semialdehyde 2,1-aminomutase
MECVAPLGSVYQAGTLSGNPVAVSAGLATIKTLEENKDLYSALENKSNRLQQAMKKSGFNVNRVGSIMTPFFTDTFVENYGTAKTADTEQYAKYYKYMLEMECILPLRSLKQCLCPLPIVIRILIIPVELLKALRLRA